MALGNKKNTAPNTVTPRTYLKRLQRAPDALKALVRGQGVAIRSRDMSRSQREQLERERWLFRVMKGWYIARDPELQPDDQQLWLEMYWLFCASYLEKKHGDTWCVSPQQSVALYAGRGEPPELLLIRAPGARNKITPFPFGMSLFEIRAALPLEGDMQLLRGLRLFSPASALVNCPGICFLRNPDEMQAVLLSLPNVKDLLRILREGGHTVVAGRLVGALRLVGRQQMADRLLTGMREAGYEVWEKNPFLDEPGAD